MEEVGSSIAIRMRRVNVVFDWLDNYGYFIVGDDGFFLSEVSVDIRRSIEINRSARG